MLPYVFSLLFVITWRTSCERMDWRSANKAQFVIGELFVMEETIKVQSCELVSALIQGLFLNPNKLSWWINNLKLFSDLRHWEGCNFFDSHNLNSVLWTVLLKTLFNIESYFSTAEYNFPNFGFSESSCQYWFEGSSVCKLIKLWNSKWMLQTNLRSCDHQRLSKVTVHLAS